MKKNNIWTILCIICAVAIVVALIVSIAMRPAKSERYSDGIEQIDPNTIYLEASGVTVSFSDVILSKQEETRKLIVSKQEADIDFTMTDSMIKSLNVDWLKRNQKVSYKGEGYFVVDLDKITAADLIDDPDSKTLTIKINHAYLETVDIDPNKVTINDPETGLLAWGQIKLTIKDYNSIEKEIKSRMVEKFNTAANGQEADDIALRMVKEIYEPVVKAVDDEYEVKVEFR